MNTISGVCASLAAEFRIIGRKKLVRVLAIVGFCNGILISGLILFAEWHGVNLGGNASAAIMLILFPTIMQVWEFEGEQASEVVLLLVCSTTNGCFYGIIGLLILKAMRFLRQRAIRNGA